MALLDIVVCHTAALGFLGELVVRRVGIARDDVPSVDEAGQDTQAAEGDVDQRVGRADAALDPYCKATISDCVFERGAWSMLHQRLRGSCGEGVGGGGRHSPAMGGNRMARKPKKMSLPHMMAVWCLSGVVRVENGSRRLLKAVASSLKALTPAANDASSARHCSALLVRHTHAPSVTLPYSQTRLYTGRLVMNVIVNLM